MNNPGLSRGVSRTRHAAPADIAVKLLPADVSATPECLPQFEREAQVLASRR